MFRFDGLSQPIFKTKTFSLIGRPKSIGEMFGIEDAKKMEEVQNSISALHAGIEASKNKL